MKYLISILLLIALYSCNGPYKPDFVDKDGKEYEVRTYCLKSHEVSEYCYHYGYNMMNGKFDWHFGLDTKTVCDSMKMDTVEINLKEKFYAKK